MMPAYNFQIRFVPMILDGSKPHTIRRKRKRPTKVGDVLYLYIGLRTKQCKLVAVSECVKLERIAIYPDQQLVGVDGVWLNYHQIKELAERDGFKNVQEFFKFFEDHYSLPISDFEIIWWNLKKMKKVRTLLLVDDPFEDLPEEEVKRRIENILKFEPKVKKERG